MSSVSIHTHFNIDIEFETPAFYRRILAWLVDLVVQLIYLFVTVKILNAIDFFDGNGGPVQIIVIVLLTLPFIGYHMIFEILTNGQSIGKMIVGMRVISDEGGRPSISQYLIRGLIRTTDVAILAYILIVAIAGLEGLVYQLLGAVMFLLFLADVIMVNSSLQRRLGDLLAGTLVVNTKQREMISDTIFRDVEASYVPSFPEVMRLTDRDINSLKDILEVSQKRDDHRLASMAAGKIQNHLKIQTELDDLTFLQVLLTDYNYLAQHT